jgi:hypothetical protein
MKRISKAIFILLIANSLWLTASSQEVNAMLKEAENLEIKLKEPEALDKYKEVLVADPKNIKALVKSTELNVYIGGRQKEKKDKQLYFQSALAFAQRAVAADEKNADANYAMALANSKLWEIEKENKKLAGFIKETKNYADKALAINPNHGKANYILGKWNVELFNMADVKRTAVKIFFGEGNIPTTSIEQAIPYFEKCRKAEPYFMLNYLELAKAYKQDNKPPKAIEVLQKLVKLPIWTVDDKDYKTEGQKMLDEMN